MLHVVGRRYCHCDGMARRDFLKVGALGFGGLTLADGLRADDVAGTKSTHSVINIHLDGGPPQMDTIDMKPDAPSEIRSDFAPIATSMPGFMMCELMPQIAATAHKYAFVRSVVGSTGAHDAFQCQTGFNKNNLASIGGRPAMGSILAKLESSPDDIVPMFVDLMQGRPLVRNSARPGFLGPAYQPFRPDISKMFVRPLEEGMKKELATLGPGHSTPLTLIPGLDAKRLEDRKGLLRGLDRIRYTLDRSGAMEAMDRFTQQAVAILTSGQFADAMDLSKEDPRTIARYLPRIDKNAYRFVTAEGESAAKKLLLARRLLDVGVRYVSVSFSDFDTHSKNFPRMRLLLPIVDHAIHTLVSDLEERGMLDDVTIVVWGEFGRTPRINKDGGRDHWTGVSPAILVGGGTTGGQVIGATDRTASTVKDRPVHFQEVMATIYHNLGIDLSTTTISDPTGRPQYLLEAMQPISELV